MEPKSELFQVLVDLTEAIAAWVHKWRSQPIEPSQPTAIVKLPPVLPAIFAPIGQSSIETYDELVSEITQTAVNNQQFWVFPDSDVIDAEWQEIPYGKITEEGLYEIANSIREYSDVQKEIANEQKEIAERQLAELRKISYDWQNTIRGLQQELIQSSQDNLLTVIQAGWDLKKWKGVWSPQETLQKFRQSADGIQVFFAPLNIGEKCPDPLTANLNTNISNEVGIFLENKRFFNQQELQKITNKTIFSGDKIWKVSFHGNYFDQSITEFDANKLCDLISPVPSIVMYGDTTDRVFYIKIGCQGFFTDKFSEFSYKFEWRKLYDDSIEAGKTPSETYKIISNLVVAIFKLISIFWIDIYYTISDPNYIAWLVRAEGSAFLRNNLDFRSLFNLQYVDAASLLSTDWIEPCSKILNQIRVDNEFNILSRKVNQNWSKIQFNRDFGLRESEFSRLTIGLISKALELDRKNPDLLLKQGLLFADFRKYEKAIRSFELAIEHGRNLEKYGEFVLDAFEELGEVQYLDKRYDKAIESLSNVVRQRSSSRAYLRLSDIYYETSNYGDALDNHEKAKDCDSCLENKLDWLLRYGQLLALVGRCNDSKKVFDRIIREHGYSDLPAEFYYFYGRFFIDIGQYKRAIDQYKIGYHLYPDDQRFKTEIISILDIYRERGKRKEEKEVLTYLALPEAKERLAQINQAEFKNKLIASPFIVASVLLIVFLLTQSF